MAPMCASPRAPPLPSTSRMDLLIALRIPAPTKGLVELDYGIDVQPECLRFGQFGIEQRALGVEHLEVARNAAVIACPRQGRGATSGRYLSSAGFMFCTVGPHGDQRVLDLAEGPLHGLFVSEQSLLGAGLLGFDAAPV